MEILHFCLYSSPLYQVLELFGTRKDVSFGTCIFEEQIINSNRECRIGKTEFPFIKALTTH